MCMHHYQLEGSLSWTPSIRSRTGGANNQPSGKFILYVSSDFIYLQESLELLQLES